MHLFTQDVVPQKKCTAESILKYPHSFDKCPFCPDFKKKQSKSCWSCMIKRRRPPEDLNVYSDEGYLFRRIPLTQGQYAIVDATDYDELNRWAWSASWEKGTKSYYARRHMTGNLSQIIMMHRQILGLEPDDSKVGDHKDPNLTLDNRRRNLRISTRAQNSLNARRQSGKSSQYKGVSKKSKTRWSARFQGKHLGYFRTEIEAHNAYRDAAKQTSSEFARFE